MSESIDITKAENIELIKDAIGLELSSLMYETDIDKSKFVKENCPSGTEMLYLINTLIDNEESPLTNLKYCYLDDASSIEIYFYLIKDRLNNPTTDIDVTTIDNIGKLQLDLPTYRLLDKNYTFYESFGYIPIGVNIQKINLPAVPANAAAQAADNSDNVYLWVDNTNSFDFEPDYPTYDICKETVYDKTKIEENKGQIQKYIKDLNTIREGIKKNFINMKDFREEQENPIIQKLYDDHLSKHLGFLKHFVLIAAIDKIKYELENLIFTLHILQPDVVNLIIQIFLKNKDLFPQIIGFYSTNERKILNDVDTIFKFVIFLKFYLKYIKFFLSINETLENTIKKFYEDNETKNIHLEIFGNTYTTSGYKSYLKTFNTFFNQYTKNMYYLNTQSFRALYYYFYNRHYITTEEIAVVENEKYQDLTSEDKVKELIKELEEKKKEIKPKNIEEDEELNTNFNPTQAIIDNLQELSDTLRDKSKNYIKYRKILEVNEDYIITIDELCKIVTYLWKLLSDLITEDTANKYPAIFKDLFILFFGNNGDNLSNYLGLNGINVSDMRDIMYLSETTGIQNVRLKDIQFGDKPNKKLFTLESKNSNLKFNIIVFNIKLQIINKDTQDKDGECFDISVEFPESEDEGSDIESDSGSEDRNGSRRGSNGNGGGKRKILKGGGRTNIKYVKKLVEDFNKFLTSANLNYPHPINDMYMYIKRKIEFLITESSVIISSAVSNKQKSTQNTLLKTTMTSPSDMLELKVLEYLSFLKDVKPDMTKGRVRKRKKPKFSHIYMVLEKKYKKAYNDFFNSLYNSFRYLKDWKNNFEEDTTSLNYFMEHFKIFEAQYCHNDKRLEFLNELTDIYNRNLKL